MNAAALAALKGTHVFLEPIQGLQIRCRVTNVKTSYGRARLQIEPVAGEGTAWVAVQSTRPCALPTDQTAEGGL